MFLSPETLAFHLAGFGVSALISLIAYFFGGLGGGDVKLLAATGLLAGQDYIWGIILLCYGLVAAWFLLTVIVVLSVRLLGRRWPVPRSIVFAPAVFLACGLYCVGFRL